MEPSSHVTHQAFVMELARALLQFGTPAHRLEESLTLVTRRLGMGGEFNSTPTSVVATFHGDGAPSTQLVRANPGTVNLEKLVALDKLTDRVLRGELTPADGSKRMDEILRAPLRYGSLPTSAAFAVASMALSYVFGGQGVQPMVAGGVGLIVGALSEISLRSSGFAKVFELVAAFVASLIAHWAGKTHHAEPIYLTTVTGLIVLVPGLTLTVALIELSTSNLVSGTARLMGAGVTFLKLAFGVSLGGRAGDALFGEESVVAMSTAPLWIQATGLLVAALAISVLFQAHPKDAGWILLASIAALAGSKLDPGLGAFLATAGSNLYARALGRPSRVPLMPSLVLLVPGSVGFKSVALLLQEDVVSGVSAAFSMSLTATALVAGVLFANWIVPPRRLL